jgi:homoaconitate hydratase family protein/3-isopropylmalate dehydratase small subunit
MGPTLLQKILGNKSGKEVNQGDIIDVFVDARVARDFGGANVVKNIEENGLKVDDPERTFFTFDCNPTGSDQKYAANQQTCRNFARERGIKVYDIDMGIGTHIAVDEGLLKPGEVFVSTDSHANIMGAIGAFGQGMGDVDIAAAFANGKVWFKVPKSARVILKGMPSENATAKDVVLRMLQVLGANGLLGYAAEIGGEYVDGLSLAGRITIASMCTEMGGIITLFPPNKDILREMNLDLDISELTPDHDAKYVRELNIDIEGIGPMAARPGHPEDTVDISEVRGIKIDSGFIGSCTNGRYEDIKAAAEVLKGRQIAPGVVLKVVPSTRKVWDRLLEEGIIKDLTDAGALIGNPGCAGCAAGQIGQNGPGEVTISTGNRNYKGKQGKGSVYLASPETVAASAIAGYITDKNDIPDQPAVFQPEKRAKAAETGCQPVDRDKSMIMEGRIWYIPIDNIDTDMIYHNRHLTVTDIDEMGQYAFGNLEGYEDFSSKAGRGDILVTGKNFGAGSSRQQAVDCFRSLGISLILAESFGAIYERNAVNTGMPAVTYEPKEDLFHDGDIVRVDLLSGKGKNLTTDREFDVSPFSEVQTEIYRRGGLLVKPCEE